MEGAIREPAKGRSEKLVCSPLGAQAQGQKLGGGEVRFAVPVTYASILEEVKPVHYAPMLIRELPESLLLLSLHSLPDIVLK